MRGKTFFFVNTDLEVSIITAIIQRDAGSSFLHIYKEGLLLYNMYNKYLIAYLTHYNQNKYSNTCDILLQKSSPLR